MPSGRPNPYWIAKVINQYGLIPTPPVGGNVFGPGSSVARHVATFADTTGKVIADSGVLIQAIFDTQTTAAAVTIGPDIGFIITAGRAVVGDFGGALYKRIGGPAGGGFQTADGQWWGLAETTVTPQMFGDCSGECHVFIQNAINYINGINGGTVYFPAINNYLITDTIVLSGNVNLLGDSPRSSFVVCNIAKTNLQCTTAGNCSVQRMFFYNSTFPASTNVIEMDSSTVGMTMRDCTIWGGVAAINTSSTDCLFENIYPTGNTWNIFSHGANWYLRCKIDWGAGTLPGTPTAGFIQSTPVAAAIQENNFTMCDFSGVYTDSILIDDGGTHTAFQTFVGCVFSANIVITSASGSMFSASEIGSSTFTVGTNATAVTGCFAHSAVVVSGGGKVVSGCVNIT